MRLIHLSDLHLGKRVNGFSMLEDQRYILKEILRIIDEERPNAVLISGDVYDKAVPSAEAVLVLDEFLCRLAQCKLPVLMISGNHDSAERVRPLCGRLMERSGVYVSPVYDGAVQPIVLHDAWGEVRDRIRSPFSSPHMCGGASPTRPLRATPTPCGWPSGKWRSTPGRGTFC